MTPEELADIMQLHVAYDKHEGGPSGVNGMCPTCGLPVSSWRSVSACIHYPDTIAADTTTYILALLIANANGMKVQSNLGRTIEGEIVAAIFGSSLKLDVNRMAPYLLKYRAGKLSTIILVSCFAKQPWFRGEGCGATEPISDESKRMLEDTVIAEMNAHNMYALVTHGLGGERMYEAMKQATDKLAKRLATKNEAADAIMLRNCERFLDATKQKRGGI